MNKENIRFQTEALEDYLSREGNRGREFWARSKDFSESDKRLIFKELVN